MRLDQPMTAGVKGGKGPQEGLAKTSAACTLCCGTASSNPSAAAGLCTTNQDTLYCTIDC